jgi:hypothetical protein
LNRTAIATDPRWQVLKEIPRRQIDLPHRNAAGAKFAERISFACLWAFERSFGKPHHAEVRGSWHLFDTHIVKRMDALRAVVRLDG